MPSLPYLVMQHALDSPEGTLLCPNALLHLGSRAAVDQALSRFARKGQLMRLCQGIYVRPVDTRFGPRPPVLDKVISSLASLLGETIVRSGGEAANALGLTDQVPVRPVFLTSGPNRKLRLGELTVDLRHAPRWQLVAPHQPAGDAVRALAWVGPGKVDQALSTIQRRLPQKDLEELVACRATMPAWMAEPVSALIADR